MTKTNVNGAAKRIEEAPWDYEAARAWRARQLAAEAGAYASEPFNGLGRGST